MNVTERSNHPYTSVMNVTEQLRATLVELGRTWAASLLDNWDELEADERADAVAHVTEELRHAYRGICSIRGLDSYVDEQLQLVRAAYRALDKVA
jgi:hypothetical protein